MQRIGEISHLPFDAGGIILHPTNTIVEKYRTNQLTVSHAMLARCVSEARAIRIRGERDETLIIPLVSDEGIAGACALSYASGACARMELSDLSEIGRALGQLVLSCRTLMREGETSRLFGLFQEFRYIFTWGYDTARLVEEIARWVGEAFHLDSVRLDISAPTDPHGESQRYVDRYAAFRSEHFGLPAQSTDAFDAFRFDLDITADDQSGKLIVHNWLSQYRLPSETIDMLRLLVPWILTGLTTTIARLCNEERYRIDALTGLYIIRISNNSSRRNCHKPLPPRRPFT